MKRSKRVVVRGRGEMIIGICIDYNQKYMFSCFCSSSMKSSYSSKSQFYSFVRGRLAENEIFLLELIYNNLASRNTNQMLTYDNFVNFFQLTGLWGAKLFQEFDQDQAELISFEEFLYGMSRTAKAPLKQKIELLYSFFEGKSEEGIQYKNFTKMLYNYSREEFKEILIEDGFIPNRDYDEKRKVLTHTPNKVVELDINETVGLKQSSGFEEAYKELLGANNQGTFLQIKTHDLTYKIRYSNMNSLIQQFAVNVYSMHNVDVSNEQTGRLSYDSFSNWIKSHRKLYKSYYSAFHTELWGYEDGDPSYLHSIEHDFIGKYYNGHDKQKVYVMLSGGALIICENKKHKNIPFKIICLQGLIISQASQYGIEIGHHCERYEKSIFYFQTETEKNQWLGILKTYETDGLLMNYVVGEVIGTGNFSIVYKCAQKKTDKIYALKMIETQKLTQRAIKLINNESKVMSIINHPQIVKYKEKIQTKTHTYLITQYIYGEDLFQYVKKRKFLNQFESAFILGQIIQAVMHLHKLQILHRDLKPENIMVLFKEKKQNEIFECTTPKLREGQRIQSIKIIDFGLSNHVSQLEKLPQAEKAVGTPNYIAPEVLVGRQPSFKSDNFAIGSILYFLLRGKLAFVGKNAEQTFIKTLRGDLDLEEEHWDKISYEAKDLLLKLLAVNPEERIELEEAVNHEWFGAVFERTRQSSKSAASENHHELEQIKLEDINLKKKRKRKLSEENDSQDSEHRYDRYSK